MQIDHNAYLSEAIERFKIKTVGFFPEPRMPYIILKDGLVFYGLPGKRGKVFEDILVGVVEIVKDLEYRHFQSNRALKQHSAYRFQPGDIVVELGAYLGYYAMYAAKQVGPTGRVIAVEMIPENHAVLQLNLETNFPENTVAINRGIH